MVEQVLLNLARNAMQAMDDPDVASRVLDIRVRRAVNGHSGWLEFSVADCGPGIPPEDVAQQLFTPFFTTKHRGHGPGPERCAARWWSSTVGFLGLRARTSRVVRYSLHPAHFPQQRCPARCNPHTTHTPPYPTRHIVDDDAGVREALAWLLRSRRLPSEGVCQRRGL
jgi:hypothetical protein